MVVPLAVMLGAFLFPELTGSTLVGYWPFNKQHMTNDISGNGNNGKRGADVTLTSGPNGNPQCAFQFKGKASSYVEFPNKGATLDVRKSMTVAMFVKVDSAQSQGPLFQWHYPGKAYGTHVSVFQDFNLFSRYMKRNAGWENKAQASKSLSTGWHFISSSYNYETGRVEETVDGKVVVSATIGKHELETSKSVRIGARKPDSGDKRYLSASVSCIQLYDKALTVEDIIKAKAQCLC